MKSSILHKADRWVIKILSYPGIDENTLAQKRIYWIASVAVTLMILCLTVTYHFIFPQLRILIYYGLFLSAIFMQGIISPLLLKQVWKWQQFIDQFLVAVVTLICILKLGGIPYSGGLIFVGLALVFFSLNFRERKASLLIFVVYIITVIIAGVLNPWLTVPAEMTSSVNISLFVINLLWISGFAMTFVMSFIKQGIRLEKLEADRLKELDQAKTRLYTNITHEFRTPLTIIKGMSDLIRNEPDKWLEEGCEKIDKNSGILLNLVNQMLDLSKLEAGAMPVKMIRADINNYIKFIIGLFQSVAECKKISMDFRPCEDFPVIDFDPDKLMQIVSNLLSNALKFTQEGGHVDVSTTLTDKNEFKICVSDNGKGIHEDYLPYIFDRFYRINETEAFDVPGSGLGLSLTRELVKLVNGDITVESTYGQGTKFTIALPVTYNASPDNSPVLDGFKGSLSGYIIPFDEKNKPPLEADDDHGSKPVLLIVEDNNDVVYYLHALLENDYQIFTAVNGEDGCNKAFRLVPDIIISDIMMPVMDGIEMLDRLKKDLRTSHIPVVVLTAKADIASRLNGLERGADAYLVKPFNKEELMVQLRSLIGLRERLLERYSAIDNLNYSEDKEFQREDEFMKKIREILNANLDNEKFDIQMMCREISMSRTQLYRKFRSLTDKTITEYLRSIRLHRARELLLTSDMTVAEVAYRTGFKNLSHFSRVFTREFKVNPSDSRK